MHSLLVFVFKVNWRLGSKMVSLVQHSHRNISPCFGFYLKLGKGNIRENLDIVFYWKLECNMMENLDCQLQVLGLEQANIVVI